MILSNYIENILESQEFENQISEILHFFTPLKLSKNNFLVEKGKICEYFCFIESGILQHSITVSEEEKTTYLALKNSCTAALKSYLQKTPSRKNIKALSDCELQVILVDDFKHLLKTNKAFHQFYYTLIENQIFLIDDYRIDLLTLTPEDRYKKLLLNEPNLSNKVPLHYLASFLGISTRHMSRIRKNIK
ncbi:Crp/Fnr family transcriptional regulator [Tenacibaculum ovolyticum]|uniref:Crp/Fnr family transcriptional regulator n=1 Tax=Tenacibaculum ovolyticum TaxID=104270 RepID=UPI0007ED2956|nr:cyclic nucleotide-binding domain-containing protein [Tenacibaculum ovolyticum]